MSEVEIFKQSLDVSRIVMIITIIMTLISIVFSSLSLAFQRSHNRRSVKPYCYFKRYNEVGKNCIVVKNAGLGPMMVDDIKSEDGVEMCNKRFVLTANEEIVVVDFGEKNENNGSTKIKVSYHDIYEKKYEIESENI